MFRVDLENLVRNKIGICKEYHIQPSEIDRMVYFEYEWLIADINDEQEKEKERQEAEEKNRNMSMPNYNSMMRQAQANVPKAPSMPAMPKMTLPKF